MQALKSSIEAAVIKLQDEVNQKLEKCNELEAKLEILETLNVKISDKDLPKYVDLVYQKSLIETQLKALETSEACMPQKNISDQLIMFKNESRSTIPDHKMSEILNDIYIYIENAGVSITNPNDIDIINRDTWIAMAKRELEWLHKNHVAKFQHLKCNICHTKIAEFNCKCGKFYIKYPITINSIPIQNS
jgi:hypothetical protein